MIAQINNGAISADWTLAISFAIIGFLLVALATIVGRHLVRSLDAITERLKDHEHRIVELEKQDIKHDAQFKHHSKE